MRADQRERVVAGVAQHHHELVAAEAGHDVGGAHRVDQVLRDGPDHLVAALVTEPRVDARGGRRGPPRRPRRPAGGRGSTSSAKRRLPTPVSGSRRVSSASASNCARSSSW